MAKFVIDNLEVDVEVRDAFGFTPLLTAAQAGNFELVKFLH
jgi:ankyrin repeat protein